MAIFDGIIRPEGYIGHFGLTGWWQSTFTDDEREYIDRTFTPFGRTTLTKGSLGYTSETAAGLLCVLATWFKAPKDRSIVQRILSEAERIALDGRDTIELHFIYLTMAESAYKVRNLEESALDQAIVACEKQIEISPQSRSAFKREYRGDPLPGHYGYRQLAIVREKQGRYDDALRLSQDAKKQGWSGDWDRRISRLKKKLKQTA